MNKNGASKGVLPATKDQDLVFGLIVPLGADRESVLKNLRLQLSNFHYKFNHIKLSSKLPTFVPDSFVNKDALKKLMGKRFKTQLKRKDLLMDAGNEVRKAYGGEEAVALLAVMDIDSHRGAFKPEDAMHTHTAHVIDSLKHPKEVERLRSIYGPSFIAIGIYAPPEVREKCLAQEKTGPADPAKTAYAKQLMERDEKEADDNGQRVRDAFALSDVVVDISRKKDVGVQIERLVQILFGHRYLTPTRQEYGMFLARAAQVRSGSMARQVGAAVLRDDGSVASVGTNEVAKPFGGQYWESDDSSYEEGRDFNRSVDSSDVFRHFSITDILKRLKAENYLDETLNKLTPEELFDLLFMARELEDDPASESPKSELSNKYKAVLKGTFQMGTIDYVRAVHAEMAAITDAARHGVSLSGYTMYTTTFPCHDCAKHVVASGLKELVYFEAYPKSLVSLLYDDSIDINKLHPDTARRVHFHSFVGVAPSRYLDFFAMGNRPRKDIDGQPYPFDVDTASLQLPEYSPSPKAIRTAEQEAAEDMRQALSSAETSKPRSVDSADDKEDIEVNPIPITPKEKL